jgi:hypothetical protein
MSDDAYDYGDPKRSDYRQPAPYSDFDGHDEQHDLGVCGKPDPS